MGGDLVTGKDIMGFHMTRGLVTQAAALTTGE